MGKRRQMLVRLVLEEIKNKIPYFNLIGTRTDFIRIYLRSSPTGRATPIFSLFDSLERILPRPLIPVEIQQGRGDGQVSVKSAWLPWAAKNQTYRQRTIECSHSAKKPGSSSGASDSSAAGDGSMVT